MKKYRNILIGCFLIFGIALCGCGHKHIWKAATCTEAQTCTVCGKTVGDIGEHKWIEATCSQPKTCEVCGETDGSAIGHSFTEATCSQPKTCTVCGETDGDSLPHDFMDATFTNPKTCKVCGATEGGKYVLEEAYDAEDVRARHKSSHGDLTEKGFLEWKYGNTSISWSMYDYDDDSKIWDMSVKSLGYGIPEAYFCTKRDMIFIMYTDWSGYEDDDIYLIIQAADYDGNIIGNKKIPVYSFYGILDNIEPFKYSYEGGKYYFIYNQSNSKILATFDMQKNAFVDNLPVDISVLKDYSYWSYQDFGKTNLVQEKNSGKWGYVDENGNVVKMYDDTSGFIDGGYAFVIENGQVSLIDKDYNILLENIAEAEGVNVTWSNLLCYRNGDERHYFRIGYDESESVAGESDITGDDGSSTTSNVAITPEGTIDIDSIEITPNDTVTIDEVSKTWAVVGPNMELTSSSGGGFWVYFYDHNGTIILLYQVNWGANNIMGDTQDTSNVSWYDENFNMDSVSGWKMGRKDEYGVTFIAIDGDDSNVN